MGGLFDYNNPIMSAINKFFDCILLSVFWLIFSIPVITIGASTTAFYYTVNKVIRHSRSHVWKEFWESFKSNFKQSTIIFLIISVLLAVTGFDYYFVKESLSVAWGFPKEFATIFLGFVNILLVWLVYLLTYVARFSCTTKLVFKNTFLIMAVNLLWSVLLWAILIGVSVLVAIVIVYVPILIFIMPTLVMLLLNLVLEHVYKKYMSPEDLEQEKLRNQKYDDEM